MDRKQHQVAEWYYFGSNLLLLLVKRPDSVAVYAISLLEIVEMFERDTKLQGFAEQRYVLQRSRSNTGDCS